MRTPVVSLVAVVAFVASLLASSSSSAQVWNDGSPSRIRHTCFQGIFDPIPEDLTWTWTGFEGSPVIGSVYRVRVVVAGLGCSGAWVMPQIKSTDTGFAHVGELSHLSSAGADEIAEEHDAGGVGTKPDSVFLSAPG